MIAPQPVCSGHLTGFCSIVLCNGRVESMTIERVTFVVVFLLVLLFWDYKKINRFTVSKRTLYLFGTLVLSMVVGSLVRTLILDS